MESLKYGDVSLKVLTTNLFSAEAVYNEDGTQPIAIKQTIDVNCIFNLKFCKLRPGRVWRRRNRVSSRSRLPA